jgi:hypothetical protein
MNEDKFEVGDLVVIAPGAQADGGLRAGVSIGLVIYCESNIVRIRHPMVDVYWFEKGMTWPMFVDILTNLDTEERNE